MSAPSLAPRALYEEVAELLRQRIFARELEPGSWIDEMRRSMGSTLWAFSTTRMLHDYAERLYLPAAGVAMARRPKREMAAERS